MATLKNLPKICPSCGKRLSVHAMHCNGCQTHIEGNYSLPVMMQLSAPDQQFVLDFVKSSGSLKDGSQVGIELSDRTQQTGRYYLSTK